MLFRSVESPNKLERAAFYSILFDLAAFTILSVSVLCCAALIGCCCCDICDPQKIPIAG